MSDKFIQENSRLCRYCDLMKDVSMFTYGHGEIRDTRRVVNAKIAASEEFYKKFKRY